MVPWEPDSRSTQSHTQYLQTLVDRTAFFPADPARNDHLADTTSFLPRVLKCLPHVSFVSRIERNLSQKFPKSKHES